MGWDDSMHPIKEDVLPVDIKPIEGEHQLNGD